MSELKEALAAILRVNFREPLPASDEQRVALFLERAANELVQREERVSEREREVSQREANATVREEHAGQRIATLDALGRMGRTLELKPVRTDTTRRRWFRTNLVR